MRDLLQLRYPRLNIAQWDEPPPERDIDHLRLPPTPALGQACLGTDGDPSAYRWQALPTWSALTRRLSTWANHPPVRLRIEKTSEVRQPAVLKINSAVWMMNVRL